MLPCCSGPGSLVVGLLIWWWCGVVWCGGGDGVVGLEVVVHEAWWTGGRLGLEVVGSSSGAWADQSYREEHQDRGGLGHRLSDQD